MLLVRNKCDSEAERAVTNRDRQTLASELSVSCYETSTKTKHNVQTVFTDVVREILKMKTKKESGCCTVLWMFSHGTYFVSDISLYLQGGSFIFPGSLCFVLWCVLFLRFLAFIPWPLIFHILASFLVFSVRPFFSLSKLFLVARFFVHVLQLQPATRLSWAYCLLLLCMDYPGIRITSCWDCFWAQPASS